LSISDIIAVEETLAHMTVTWVLKINRLALPYKPKECLYFLVMHWDRITHFSPILSLILVTLD
jgi:hypothetical protein